MKKVNTVSFTVTIDRPIGTSYPECGQILYDAIKSYGGACPPGSQEYHISKGTIKIIRKEEL